MVEIGERMKKVVIFIVKGCYRSIWNHPFVGGMLCFLVFMYRSYPFVFSLLVSASPVVVCTAILLGTLLSFGKPNIPEIEREERTTHGIVSLQTRLSDDYVVLDKNESVYVERYGDKEKDVVDVVDQLVNETSYVANEICRAGSDGSVGLSLEKRSKEIEFDGRVTEERRREFVDLELESKSEIFEERIVKNGYSLIPEDDDETLDLENDRSPTGSVDLKVVNVDCLDSPPCTPWRHVNQEDDEEEEDDEAFDSGSERAESSSPDASMADILPVLDELHPLLDEDAPRPLNLPHDVSESSDESSNESDDDTEKEVSEVAEDDKEGEDEEETHEEGDQAKSAITWTEEDERNLMDLGSSELERNQRLENLIARRRAWKPPSMAPEINLIDLESTDFTFNVPPILTTRNNPFDVSQDSYKDMGLPPIPGSAPSILLQRENPFDIPYDSSEEKPDLKEGSFQQEFTPFQSKEHFVRRHESFNAWRTPFKNNRPEKKDTSRFRPYFVAEPLGSEGTSYSHFQRQLSGLSDSIASSVPDTGSIGSSEEAERWNVSEEGTYGIEDGNNVDDDIIRELDFITRSKQASELAGHGSESFDAENSIELDQLGKRLMETDETDMKLGDTEYRHEAESSLVAEQRLANQFEISFMETYSNVEGHEQRYRNISSSSSLSEESERVYVEKEVEEYPSFIDRIYQHEEHNISAQSSEQGSFLSITSPLRDDDFNSNPVYDLSPLDVKETVSRSSNGSDLASLGIKKSVSFSEIVTVIGSQEMESDATVNREMLFESSEMIQVDESQITSSSDVQITKHDDRNETENVSGEDMEMTEHNEVNCGFSEDEEVSGSAGVSETETISRGHMEMADHVDVNDIFSGSDTISASATLSDVPETFIDHITETLMSPNSAGSTEKLDSADSHCNQSVSTQTDEQNMVESKEELELENVERGSPAPLNMLSSTSQSIVDHTTQGESVFSEQGIIQSSFDRSDLEDSTLTPPRHLYPNTGSSDPLSVEEVALPQNSFYKPSPEDHKEALESEISVKSVQKASTADSWSNYGIPQIDNKLPLVLEVPTNPESIEVPPEVFGSQAVDELDEIKEIDEHFLDELDTVGDFRVNEFREVDDHAEFGRQVSHVQHDAESSLTLIEENSTQTHATEQVVRAVELGPTIKEFDRNDEDMKHVSDFKIHWSHVDPIDPLQYNGIGLDDFDQSIEENTYSKAKETDIEVNSLEEISDIEKNDTVVAETEAHVARTIEAMKIKDELTPAETGVVHLDPPPLFVGSQIMESSKTQAEAENHMENEELQDLDLDLNQPLEENIEQVCVSGSVLSAEGAKRIEETFPELLESERQFLSDSDSALKQESRSTPSEALGFSEVGTVEDIQADLDFNREPRSGIEESEMHKSLSDSDSALKQESRSTPSEALRFSEVGTVEDIQADLDSNREPRSGIEESEMQKTLGNSSEESDMVEAKSHESDDVLISERKSLDDSFSDLKQESQNSPSVALEVSEDVRDNLYSPQEANSRAEDSYEKTQQNSLDEPYGFEVKTPESHDVLISERRSLDDSDLALKQESSSLTEAFKLFEDGLADTDSPRKAKSGAEESDEKETQQTSSEEPKFVEVKTPESLEEYDVKETQQNSSEEPNCVEIKTPEYHDPTVSDVGNDIKDTYKKRSS